LRNTEFFLSKKWKNQFQFLEDDHAVLREVIFDFYKTAKNHYARLPKTIFKYSIFLIAPHARLPDKNRIFNIHFGPLRKILTQNAKINKNREKKSLFKK
jgi:hypothetical protein